MHFPLSSTRNCPACVHPKENCWSQSIHSLQRAISAVSFLKLEAVSVLCIFFLVFNQAWPAALRVCPDGIFFNGHRGPCFATSVGCYLCFHNLTRHLPLWYKRWKAKSQCCHNMSSDTSPIKCPIRRRKFKVQMRQRNGWNIESPLNANVRRWKIKC